ncbi:PEP-CTERM domain protein [Oopsacas minuta]|uniref:PEP-CTERM domain protein n=1 Tax=Oopsacas minuta TaxID=111878 RepID=A0AAV7JS48_9METZ|nr:PEP-CTERM domain protein [Oopsacas minuta]
MSNHSGKSDFQSQIAEKRELITTSIANIILQLRGLESKLLQELTTLEREYEEENMTETENLINLTKVKNNMSRVLNNPSQSTNLQNQLISRQIQMCLDRMTSKNLILVWDNKIEDLLLSEFCKIVVIEKPSPSPEHKQSETISNAPDLDDPLIPIDDITTELSGFALNINTNTTISRIEPSNYDHSLSLIPTNDISPILPEPFPEILEPNYIAPVPVCLTPSDGTSATNYSDKVRRELPDQYRSAGVPIYSACPYGSGRSELMDARGIAVQRNAKRIYIADRGNNRVQVFRDTGKFVFSFTDIEMEGPKGICIKENLGLVFVTMCDKNSVHCYSLDGYLLRKIGRSGVGLSQFNQPCGIATDNICKVYVCDFGNNRIQVFTKDLRCITILTNKVTEPTDVKIINDVVYILDHRKLCVSTFSRGGAFMSEIVSCGPESYQVKHPYFFDIDSRGNFLISDLYNDCIKVFSPSGKFLCDIGAPGDDEGQFIRPTGIALVESCIVTICERAKNQLQIFKLD